MRAEQIAEAGELIRLLRATTNELKKKKIRNSVYEILRPFFAKWIKSLYPKTHFPDLNEKEILSLSWDCFEYGLSHWKPGKSPPIPNHFYAYSKYYLQSKFKRDRENATLSGGKGPEPSNLPSNAAYDQIEELTKFRDCLDNKYKSVFDDALMSMTDNKRDRVRRLEKTSLAYSKYCESKNIFKIVIDFLIRR